MEILPIEHPRALERSLAIVNRERTIIFPTDTVYGLGAAAFSQRGINYLYEIKGRSQEKAIAILIGNLDQLPAIVMDLPPSAEKLTRKFWPGALTLVVNKNPDLPENLSPLPTIGIRMPRHEFALLLLRLCGPLATTSANLSGKPEGKSVIDVMDQLGDRSDLILDGGSPSGGIPSTVVDCTSSPIKILRKGTISEEEIFTEIG